MRVHAHQYSKVQRGAIVDGAILMHEEMAELLRRKVGMDFVDHDVTTGPECLRAVKDGDVVYAGIGPYAYLYHLWREAAGVDFRIVREVHTSFWSGYYGQEELCVGWLRDGDVALLPTEYTRQLYAAMIPQIGRGGAAVVYPQLDRLKRLPPRGRRGRGVRIGYLGALSAAKNFDQVIRVFQRVHAGDPDAKLVFAGKPNNAEFEGEKVCAQLAASGVGPDALSYRGILPRASLSAFFEDIDLLFFPSTASRETLGRVVLESLAHGVPVLAADVGPAVELLPEQNLVPTRLRAEVELSMARCEALGVVDEQAAAEKILKGEYAPAAILDESPYRDTRFWDVLVNAWRDGGAIARHDARIVRALRVEPREQPAGEAEARAADELFRLYFKGEHEEISRRLDAAALDDAARASLCEVLGRSPPNLADYRAFPRLIDALVLRPLKYTLSEAEPTGGHEIEEIGRAVIPPCITATAEAGRAAT